jgi:hypothetical protein
VDADIVVSNANVAYTYRNLIPATYRRHSTGRKQTIVSGKRARAALKADVEASL